ncbi:MAG: sugar porter family MFS transporter [Candidatus Glassbacteria bacterium]|nr:sugar porter family MFS transporter [Candidatus Glassbacteria bacterium]
MSYVIGLSAVASIGGLLFGYDTAVISGAIGLLRTKFELDSAMTGWAASSALAGCMLGVALAGPVSDRLGRKKALIGAAVFFLVSALGTALPRNITEFVICRMLGGVGVGAASMVSPMYIAEISPPRLRGRMVSLNQLAIVSGILLVYFVNYFIAAAGDAAWNVEQGWRWMFGSEALPAVLLLTLLFFVPESPRWLVKEGHREKAKRILLKASGHGIAEAELLRIENSLGTQEASLSELFRPGMRVVLAIGIVLAVLSQVTGINVIMYYAPEIFKQVGSGLDTALLQTVAVGTVNLAFTFVAIWAIDRLGRKPLMIVGAAGMALAQAGIGVAVFTNASPWLLVAFVLGYIACFASSLGPVCWVVLAEIFPTRIRGRAMSLAIISLWGANLVVSQTFPMLNEHPWLVEQFRHSFPFLVYGLLCVVTVVFVLKVIPETRGMPLEEIEKMWHVEPV